MSRGKSIPSRSFPQLLSVNAGRRMFGVLLLLVSLGMYLQLSEMNVRDERTSQTNEALIQALTAEQQSAVSKGEIPVAPAPDEIVKNPEIVTIKGEKGDKGDPGIPGKNGVNGKDGENASPAPTPSPLPGEPGRDGADGKDGVDGVDGADGADGQPGEKGDKGDPGSPPSDITLTIDGVKYICTPVTSGSTSFQCTAQEEPTPQESGSAS